MDEKDEMLLRALQDDVPLVRRPFLTVGERLGISEEEAITRVQKMMDRGIVKRFSASINHRKLGITANALCIWKVPEERVDDVGERIASFGEVTHCYERPTIPGKWDYNLFAMIHGYDRESVEGIARHISEVVGIYDYELLYSTKEFKKVYKRY